MSISDHSVASVGTTIESCTDIVVLGENVDELALAFITPLGTKDDTEFRFEAGCAAGYIFSD